MQAVISLADATPEYARQVQLLGAPEWEDRAQSFHFLTEAGQAALDALIEGTRHADWRVRRGCADLMDHLADDRCTGPLVHLLHDPVEAVRRLAVHALSCQGCKACPLDVDIVAHLIERIETDTSRRVRRVAVHQLGCQPPDTRALGALHALLERESDTGLLSRARWALAQQEQIAASENGGRQRRLAGTEQ